MKQAALRYYDQGFCPVLLHSRDGDTCSCGRPDCRAQGKHPRLRDWAQRAARATRAEVEAWWDQHPKSHVGLLTGNWSDVAHPEGRARRWVVALDVDAKSLQDGSTGLDTLSAWEEEHGRLPATPSAKTPSGGAHYLFEAPPEPIPTRAKILPGVDIRASQNGQIVVEPSPGYHWDADPTETPIAAMPYDLLKLVSAGNSKGPSVAKCEPLQYAVPEDSSWPPVEERVARATRYLAKQPGAVEGSNGSGQFFNVCQVIIRSFALPAEKAIPLIREYNARCTPPFSDKEVRHKVADTIQKSRFQWGNLLQRAEVVTEDSAWRSEVTLDAKTGCPCKTRANVMLILENTDGFKDAFKLDEFSGKIMLCHETPAHVGVPSKYPRAWCDTDDSFIARWLERSEWLMDVNTSLVIECIPMIAKTHPFHPLRDYLNGLQWDGVIRAESFMSKYLSAEDNAYTRAVGRKWLISAVARIFDPGCKVDTMPVLEGLQGARKSSFLATLAVKPDWFCDRVPDMASDEACKVVAGKWIVEIGELSSVRKSDTESVKAFLSRQTDRYRPSYGRNVIDQPRACVFCGTTNKQEYLRDETGNRRFWPVKCGKLDHEAIARDVDQIWAESVQRYRSGEAWWFTDAEDHIAKMAEVEQEKRVECSIADDSWWDRLSTWLDAPTTQQDLLTKGISINDALSKALDLDPSRHGPAEQQRVGACLQKLGLKPRQVSIGGGRRPRRYFRQSSEN